MRLLKLYEAILKYCAMVAGPDGKIDVSFGESRKPCMIDDKRLALPTKDNLRADPSEKLIIFHPLREYIDRGESIVVRKMRHHINIRLNFAVYALASQLFTLIADTARHDQLTPEQRELLLQVQGVDATTNKRLVEYVTKGYKGHETRYFVNIYLKRAGVYQGQKHARVGVTTFPFFDLLKDESVKTSRISDRQTFKQMLEFIFPGSSDSGEEWNSFSDSRNAPWLECLMKTSIRLTDRINELARLYKDFISSPEDIVFESEWVDDFDNLESYQGDIMSIPTQHGNEGTLPQKSEGEAAQGQREESTREVNQAQAVREAAVATSESASTTAVSPTSMPLPRSVAERRHLSTLPPAPPVRHAPPPQHVPVRSAAYQPPHAPQQAYQPPPPPQVVTPEGKLDLDAVLATNPMVAQGMYTNTPLTAWHNSQQQRSSGYPQQGYPQQGYPQQGGYYDARGAYIGPAGGGYPQQGPGYGYPQQGPWAGQPQPQQGYRPGYAQQGGYGGAPYIAPI